MTKLVCVKCQTEYSSKLGEIGVIVVEMAHNPPVPYRVWGADLLSCPGCGAEVVSGFSDRPIARDKAAAVLLANTLRIGKARIVYDHERPVMFFTQEATPTPADYAAARAIITAQFPQLTFEHEEQFANIIAAHRDASMPKETSR